MVLVRGAFGRYFSLGVESHEWNECLTKDVPQIFLVSSTLWVHCVCVLVAQSCLTLLPPMDCSLPGSSVPGILQARLLERVAIPFSRDLPDPGIKPGSPALKADSLLSEHTVKRRAIMNQEEDPHLIMLALWYWTSQPLKLWEINSPCLKAT